MPTFEISDPKGQKYHITAPDGASQDDVLKYAQANFKAAVPPDKYHAQAQQEFDALKAQGAPVEAGYARRIAQGMTFGGADELIAGAETPLEMIKRGTLDPREGYNHAKAFQDVQLADARRRQGALGEAAEIAGGVGSAGGLAKNGVTLVRNGAGIVGRALGMAGEGAGYGGVSGFLDGGNSLEERTKAAGKGAVVGGAVGGALPIAAAVGKAIVAPVVSNIAARVNPGGVAESQLARAVDESGRPVADIARDVQTAAAQGQPMYTVADAMGFPGQRLLRTGISAQGPGRTNAVEFLEQRQAGQGRRIANTLAEGFDAPHSAAQTGDVLTSARDTAANAEYGAVRAGAAPVDLTKTLGKIDETLSPGVDKIVSPQSNIAPDSVEAALQNVRSRLSDGHSVATDFDTIYRARGDLADQISKAQRAGEGNKVRLLTQVKGELDTALENSSQGFRQANQNYARRSGVIDAIDTGRTAAMRGRTEDTIPAFRGLSNGEQSAYRVGYADPLIAQTQSAASGANKARPLTSDAFRTEAPAIAPLSTGNQMMQRLGREQRMFETRAEATGGSKTDMNLADQASQRIDPSLIASALTGNHVGVAHNMLSRVTDALNGYTPAVRERIVQLLLESGPAPTTEQAVSRALARRSSVNRVSDALARGLMSGAALSSPQLQIQGLTK